MKKECLGSRLLSLLLVAVMVVSMIPVSVFAVAGDIIGSEDIGFAADTLDQADVINWPVKIYDYLNDGMLFETANSRADADSVAHMVYGGGVVMPKTALGMDYTVEAAYTDYAYTWTTSKLADKGGGNYVRERKAAVRFDTPQYLRVSYPGTGSYDKMMLYSFIMSGPLVAQEKAKIKYLTIVYRANGIDPDERIDILLENSADYSLYGFMESDTNGLDLEDTAQWKYLVVDMEAALGATKWAAFSKVSGVYLASTMDDSGDYIDLSHVAYFDNAVEARNYGEDAAAFANEPGEHLEVEQKLTFESGTVETEYYGAADEPGYDLSPTNTSAPSSASTSTTRLGLNFALGTGQTTSTYSQWVDASAVTMYSTTTTSFKPTVSVANNNSESGRNYVTITGSGTSGKFILTNFSEKDANGVYYPRAQYVVLVYRANGYTSSDKIGFWSAMYNGAGTGWGKATSYAYKGYESSSWLTDSNVYKETVIESPYDGVWVADVIPLASAFPSAAYLKFLGMYLPTGAGKSLDLAYVAYFADQSSATTFSTLATAYMNVGKIKSQTTSGGTTKSLKAGRTWNMGNNLAYGLLFASDSNGWEVLGGGNNTNPNGYYAYAIGYDMRSGQDSSTSTVNQYRKDFSGQLYKDTGDSNQIYLMNAQSMADFSTLGYYDMSGLSFDGYSLKQRITQGWLTAGMLEGSLKDSKPVYRQETVEYLANLIYETLIIPPFDADGDYNYNFVKGERSSQFAFDINGDGDLEDHFDLTGDTYEETAEASMDLATALRICLGISFTYGSDKGTYANGASARGTYADTLTRVDSLMGQFNDVRGHITTCVDAAYYLLANLFVESAYSQPQDDYGYLTLSGVTLNDGREAYVFDAGFTTGSGTVTESGYADSSQSALDYSPYVKEEDGQLVFGDGTISLQNVASKDKVSIDENDKYNTTRFPFLPVTDTEGDYPDETESPYFADDGIMNYTESGESYESRNFNYVMVSNGEFVYYEDDGLFFEFEGDDDVYLFLNDQLVLDIGGAHGISKAKMNVNDYVEWARGIKADATAYAALTQAEKDRVDALALAEGQICSFDFYYMERHGYGANCRIVTNMHITDPKLGVEKNATQFGEKVEFGGAVDASSPIGYEFKLTNTGNTKLYNLTFTDDIIGVKLDPENGLTVAAGMNGSHVRDAYGGTLEASDLTAVVTGTNDAGVSTTVNVTFSSNDELKSFLKSLQADGTESGLEGAEITNAGGGLWVGSSVSIRGMYYMLTLAQVEKGGMENIVYVTATTKYETDDAGNETLRSDAKHRVYTSGAPVYYQWAEHELFLSDQEMVTDSILEAVNSESQLNKYWAFFDQIDITDSNGTVTGADLSKVHIALCDKYGNPGVSESAVSQGTGSSGATGYYINYPNAGTYSFHVLVHLNSSNGGYGAGTKASAMAEGTFAIIRITVYVADVDDSVFVLDYGLKTESLDAGGALFKGDELFGASGTMQAKLMGVSTSQPSYLSARTYSAGNRITFSSLGVGDMRKIIFPDGYFNMNVAIDSDGKDISYDASNGTYSLTEIGTVRLNADVPSDWTDVRAYYWYDNGANNGWPGTPMTKKDEGGSSYYLDIPADVGYVIINNGNSDQKTDDLEITPGVESAITVKSRPDGDTYYPAVVSNVVKYADVHVSVPTDWSKVYLYCWRDDGTYLNTWPGEEMTLGTDGKYTGKIPSETSYVIVNDGSMNQTNDLDVLAGKEVWISLDSESYGDRDDGKHMYTATMAYNQSSYTVHAKVPETWNGAYLHYWLTGTADGATQWPGVAMTKGTDGWYFAQVPAGVSYMVVNCGDTDPNTEGAQVAYQTLNLSVNAGLEAWITVEPNWAYQYDGVDYYNAAVAYSVDGEGAGFTFTPTDFLETESSIWLALTVHTTGKVPSKLEDDTIDINNEVQMFKKVTVLPATVVYYEDDFVGIDYPNDIGGSFQRHGEGSGKLTQSVDQSIPYGQDPTYQDAANSLYSGDTMTQFQITGYDTLAEFTFTGTGFELIGRTDACKSGIIVVEVFDETDTSVQYFPVINEFDNGANGGAEGIYQVPVIRIKGLEHGKYRVVISGNPTYDFDRWEAEGGDIENYLMDTYLHIDGLRIYQPIEGGIHEAYNATENGAQFLELRDLITGGTVAVGDVTSGGLTLSSGTTTWTENLLGDDFDAESEVFVGNQVDSSEDYLIQGPNNEVYMEGTISNSALVFYVKEDASAAHELQLAIRALDYRKFFGTGYSALNAPIQYGVQLADGSYAWKPLATVQSGTEQYYSIPYTECPQVDGKYQVVIRANGTEDTLSMVSYSSLKLVGLELMKVDGVGEDTILYYENGILVNWLLWGDINGETLGADETSYYRFRNGKLTVTFAQDSYVALKTSTNTTYMIDGGDVDDKTSATMVKTTQGGKLFVPGGKEVTFTLTQNSAGDMVLSYCAHSYEEEVVQQGSCTVEGITVYTCTACQYEKTITTAAPGHALGEGQQTTDPTCTAEGVMSYVCGTCQATITEPIPALGHTMDQGTETTAPGCETEGVMTFTCTVCGHTETEAIPANGHSMGEGGICTNCGEEVCEHQWGTGTVTMAATCVTDGVKAYTCSLCGAIKTETIPAPGHTMVDGSCTVCDYTTVRTVYFRNSQNWSNVNVYAWSDAGVHTGGWPGTAMTLVEGSTNLYRYNVPLDAVNVIFNDGGGNQTGDLTFPTDGRDLYSWAIGGWVTYEPPVLSREYCLMGFINGADYGTGSDWASVGTYIFVGQTLTVTFQTDSYVAIKTTDSGSWYWAPYYISDTTGTFYLNGNNEKMFVPGGKEITFTLVENADGSLNLSYVAAGAAMLSSGALELSSIGKQMSATYVVGAAVSVEEVQQPEEETTSVPSLTMKYPSLSFESEVQYNIYYTVENAEMVLDMGLLVFDSQLTDGTIANATQVLPGFETDGSIWLVKTGGISAKNLGDTLYFKVYAQLTDGSYVYSDMKSYCAVDYANTILGRASSSDYMKSLVVAMLNYGAQAQLFFGHDTDALMNAGLTAEQQALVSAYDESMMDAVVSVDEAKVGSFVYDGSSFTRRAPTVSFDGAFAINYYFTAANVPDDGMTLYYWNMADYTAASVLTVDNATGSMEMVATDMTNQYWGQVAGIAAKELDSIVFVVGVYEHDGVSYNTGVLNYSIGKYCEGIAANDASTQQAFAQATAVYGYCAKEYFANL